MKRAVVAALLLLTGSVSSAVAADGLGLFFGASHFVIGEEPNTYNVDAEGMVGGLLIPVHLLRTPLFVKIKAVYHGADYVSPRGSAYGSYMHASNSLLVGAKTWRGETRTVQILLGPGIHNESAYAEWGAGVSAAEVFVDASLLATWRRGRNGFGVMASLEHGLTSDDLHLVSNQRAYLAAIAMF